MARPSVPILRSRMVRYLRHFLETLPNVSMKSPVNLESLLISRDAALLGVLRPTLEKLSVEVEVCSGAQTGGDLLGKRKFDAVIVDCDDMQGGIDILKGLRKTQSNATSV